MGTTASASPARGKARDYIWFIDPAQPACPRRFCTCPIRRRTMPATFSAPATDRTAQHAHQSVSALDPQGNPLRCRSDQPPADAARRDDPQAGLRSLHLAAAGVARPAQGRGDRPRGDEQGWCPGGADAGHPARRAVAGVRPLGAVRSGTAAQSRTATSATSASARPTRK